MLGVYVKWDSEAVPADTVAKWNVKVLDVSKVRNRNRYRVPK